MAWYEEWFGTDAYALVYGHRDEDEAADMVDLVEEAVSPRPGARILDVGCGRGRHARVMARRGYRVTGIDLSERSITEARSAAEPSDGNLTFMVGDMRDPVCEACFDGVVNLFTAFGYFDEDAENKRALAAMATALVPGGWWVQDFLNAPRVVETLSPEDTDKTNGITVTQRRWIEDGRIHKEIHLDDGDYQETYRESVRLFTLEDLAALYDEVGLDLTDTYGDYDGAPYTPASPRLILVARKHDE